MSAPHPPFATAPHLADPARIAHGFFGRRGGVSRGIYASLNAGPGSGDQPGAVAENRARIAAAIGAPGPAHLVSCHQVHGVDVAEIGAPPERRPEADAMVTTVPGLALCILTADCVPILFADETAGVIGAAHAGWKGALAGVAEACVEAMVACGADPSCIRAAIGPAIGPASYEVGPEFRDRFLAEVPSSTSLFSAGAADRFHFDLPGFLERLLIAAGLGSIERLGEDTCAQETAYFSNRRRHHRGEPDYGRNASVIVLRD